MNTQFKTIALVGRVDDDRVVQPMRSLAEHLTKAGVSVIADSATADVADAHAVAESDLGKQADLVIAVGGDGTMLYGARLIGEQSTPLLGVNRGRLGFLADVSPRNMLEAMDQVLAGDYIVESRLLLDTTVVCPDGRQSSAIALNDVVLQRRETGRMVDFETRIAGSYINTHAGDGLIVATPTGSTAYALSCGGPIIEPGLDVVALVPICPHTLSDRPIVVPASSGIEVVLLERGDTKADVIVDGRSLDGLLPGGSLTISASKQRLSLIHPPGYDYYDILRSKLNWGKDTRNRASSDQGDD